MTCFGYSGNKEIETPTDELKHSRKFGYWKGKKNNLAKGAESSRLKPRLTAWNAARKMWSTSCIGCGKKELLSNYDVLSGRYQKPRYRLAVSLEALTELSWRSSFISSNDCCAKQACKTSFVAN
jgi:hypothetical protein